MKSIALAAAIAATTCPSIAMAQKPTLEDRAAIIDVITDTAAGADRHQWDRVRAALADTVTLDYTSLWGGAPSTLSAEDVVEQWSGLLPGFDATQHLVTNHAISTTAADAAAAEADFQAAHRLGGEMWILMGRYRYELVKRDGSWRITRLVMTWTHETGDRGLLKKAAARASRPE